MSLQEAFLAERKAKREARRNWILVASAPKWLGPVHALMHEIAQEYSISVDQLKGDGRQKLIAEARLKLYWRAMTETGVSSAQIGKIIGGRDHTTVLSGVKRYASRNGLPLPRGMQWGR